MMYGHPTGLMNTFNPQSECIHLPEIYIPPTQVEVKVATGNTGPRQHGSWKWKAHRLKTKLLQGIKTLDYTGKFVFDSRLETDANPAHILDNTLTSSLLIRETLEKHFQKKIDVHIVLRERTTDLALESCHLLGFPTIVTDDDVKGEIATVSENEVPSLRARLFDFDFGDSLDAPTDVLADKIFISRRGNRKLVNEAEVISFLEKRGFKVLYFEDFSVKEKWAIARNAKVVVAINGAAVGNFLFNRLGLYPNAPHGSGVRVVELMSPAWMHIGFRSNILAVNGSWCAVRGQITPNFLQAVDFSDQAPDPTKPPRTDSFKVDCDTIQMALDYLAENY